MRQRLFVFGILIVASIGLIGYSLALLDWINDFKSGQYANNHAEAVLETCAILLYNFAGLHFFKKRLVR